MIACCLGGCSELSGLAGIGRTKITGSIVCFYDNEKTAIGTFSSANTEEKSIELAIGSTYTVHLKPSFSGGSQAAAYIGDCAQFTYPDNYCEIKYVSEPESQPIYELVVKTDSSFSLTVTVDDYTQSILVKPKALPHAEHSGKWHFGESAHWYR